MKHVLVAIIFFLSLNCRAEIQDTTKGPHGGNVRCSDYFKIELVDCGPYIEIYLYEMDLTPIFNRQFSGTAAFCFPGNFYVKTDLYPYSTDGFTAEVTQRCFTRCTISIYGLGYIIKADFEGLTDPDEECKRPDKDQVRN